MGVRSVKSELISLVNLAGDTVELPSVREVYVPEPDPEQSHTEFGVIILEDGSAGLYYAWMGESQQGMSIKFQERDFTGKSPLALTKLYNSHDEADRSIGLAAINAVTQSILSRAGYGLKTAANSMGALRIGPGDHVGMVGYFPTFVDRLRKDNIRLTVIEKKTKFHESGDLITITAEPERLRDCNKVISTAATMLNDTIDEILGYSSGAEKLVVVGPTAGFFPDPLFSRGVTAIGGTEIVAPESLIERLRNDQGMGETANRYLIEKEDYPGIDDILKNVLENCD